MLKRTIAILLVIAALAAYCVVPASAASSGSCGANATWTLNDAGTLTISGSGAMSDYSYSNSAPWYGDRKNITSVVIKQGITAIGKYAFADCYEMISASIPSSVTSIRDYAFYGCFDLVNATIPGSVTTIGKYAFGFCSMTSLRIPNSVTTIADCAFYYCDDATSLTIGSSVATIGERAFADCQKLTTVTIPANVKSIGARSFSGCINLTAIKVNSGNPNYSSDNRGVLFNKNKTVLLEAPGAISGSYTVPSSVSTIGEYAFYYCGKLTGVTIPGSVTAIKDSAFRLCEKLNKVNMAAGVTTIGDYAFYQCDSLTSVTLPNTVSVIGYEAYSNCDKLAKVNIPASVTSIGSGAFFACTGLKAINVNGGNLNYSSDAKGVLFNKDKTVLIQAPGALSGSYSVPAGVITIGFYALSHCNNLTTVVLPNTVTTIDYDAFYSCDNLTWVTIPSSVTTIGSSAFSLCKKLTAVSLPASVQKIGYYVFDNSGVKNIYYAGNAAKWQTINIGSSNDGLKAATIHYNTVCSFPDVKPGAWYFKSVEFAVKKGYFSGYGDGSFGPSDDITRQDFAVVLSRIAKADLSKYSGKTSFTDVSSGAYYAKAIHWASSNQVIMGLNNTKFGVNNKLTREQLVTILYRYAMKLGVNVSVSAADRAKLNSYKDAYKINSYAKDAFAWALKNKVISGMSETTLGPAVTATRAQIATILMNISNYKVIPNI